VCFQESTSHGRSQRFPGFGLKQIRTTECNEGAEGKNFSKKIFMTERSEGTEGKCVKNHICNCVMNTLVNPLSPIFSFINLSDC